MAFERKVPVYNIKFAEDHEFYGLEMKMRAVNIDFYREFVQTAFSLMEFKDVAESDDMEVQVKALTAIGEVLDHMRQMFVDKLISWNMEEEGVPVPADIEGVRRLEDNEFQAITNEWLTAVGGVSPDLKDGLNTGGTFPELSSLMEPLSPSQAS